MYLALWVVLVAGARVAFEHATSWHYFDDAARLLLGDTHGLVGPGGLHLYRSHPEFQFGPISIVAAELFRLAGGRHTLVLVQVVLALSVFPVILLLEDAASTWWGASEHERIRQLCFAAGLALAVVWDDIANRVGHLDDAIALAASAFAVWALVRRRPLGAALAIGVAAAAKPWALLFLPLLWALPHGRHVRAIAIALGTSAVTWLPFVLAEPRTLAAGSFRIANDTRSALYTLGVHDAATPSWDRLAQLGAGLAIASWVAARGRWPAVFLAAVGTRLLLDPAAHRYYTASLVFAVLVWELFATRRRWPVLTLLAAALLVLPRISGLADQPSGLLRLTATGGAVAIAAFAPAVKRDRLAASTP